MARWATLIEGRRKERPVLLVDAGDFCATKKQRDKEIKDRYFFDALYTLDYDALAIGEQEILFGRRNLLETAEQQELPLTSANIFDRKTKKRIADPYIIKNVGGKKFLFMTIGGVKVGIFSVADSSLVYAADRLVREYYEVTDPRSAALEAVGELRRKGCDLVIALSHQDPDESAKLTRAVPGIDIVISSHRVGMKTAWENISGTIMIQTGVPERSFTEIEVSWNDYRPKITVFERGDVMGILQDHPYFAELEKSYKEETGIDKNDLIRLDDKGKKVKIPIKRAPTQENEE
jgi:2',3'-cyclic-nucleotide 2'-phosphodiesterase (5'-nucleotidase family)